MSSSDVERDAPRSHVWDETLRNIVDILLSDGGAIIEGVIVEVIVRLYYPSPHDRLIIVIDSEEGRVRLPLPYPIDLGLFSPNENILVVGYHTALTKPTYRPRMYLLPKDQTLVVSERTREEQIKGEKCAGIWNQITNIVTIRSHLTRYRSLLSAVDGLLRIAMESKDTSLETRTRFWYTNLIAWLWNIIEKGCASPDDFGKMVQEKTTEILQQLNPLQQERILSAIRTDLAILGG